MSKQVIRLGGLADDRIKWKGGIVDRHERRAMSETKQRWIVQARFTQDGQWVGCGPVHRSYGAAKDYAARQSAEGGIAQAYRVRECDPHVAVAKEGGS